MPVSKAFYFALYNEERAAAIVTTHMIGVLKRVFTRTRNGENLPPLPPFADEGMAKWGSLSSIFFRGEGKPKLNHRRLSSLPSVATRVFYDF